MASADRRSRSALAARFADFERTAGARAPLYALLAPRIAEDDDLLALLDDAPPEQRRPVLLFAAVHLLVLEGRDPGLAAHYPNLASASDEHRTAGSDPFPAFRRAALANADRIRSIAASSTTQTNEVGRCAWLMPAASTVSAEVGPIALVDIGASAGLNLLMPHFAYAYSLPDASVVRLAPVVHHPGSATTVELECDLRQFDGRHVAPPTALPDVTYGVGLDAAPVDIADDSRVRWLEACVWPDMVQRFHRLVAAVALARTMPPPVVAGDAVDDLSDVLDTAAVHGHPVVMTSWVLNYLSVERQREFVAELEAAAARTDLSWIVAESPAETPGIPVDTTAPPEDITVVSLVRWRSGRRTVQRIGTAHPHGFWLRADAVRC